MPNRSHPASSAALEYNPSGGMRLCELAEYEEIEKIARDEFPDVPDRYWEAVAEVDIDDPEIGIDPRSVVQIALSLYTRDLKERLERMPFSGQTDRPFPKTATEFPTIVDFLKAKRKREDDDD